MFLMDDSLHMKVIILNADPLSMVKTVKSNTPNLPGYMEEAKPISHQLSPSPLVAISVF